MIKVVKLLLVTLILVSFSSNMALAQTTPPEASIPTQNFIQERTERRTQLKERIEAHKAEVAAKRLELKEQTQEHKEARVASREARLSEAKKARTREFYGRLHTRFLAAISRLDTLISRIEARLATIKEENPDADVTQIESDLQEAKSLLLDAKVDLEAASGNFDSVLDSEDPQATFQIIKDLVMEIKGKLVEVHKLLVSIIGDIKGLRVGNTYQYGSPKPAISPATSL